MLTRRLVLSAGVLALHGCGTVPSSGSGASRPLVAERRWLDSWFHGTPVLIAQASDDVLSVEVPLDFCFEKGRVQIKPALAAVLDKVAESLRRVSLARLPLIAAPGDPASAPALALQRAAGVRQYLHEHAVPATQLGPPAASKTAAVQLRMELPAA